jgi:hypothetical protein
MSNELQGLLMKFFKTWQYHDLFQARSEKHAPGCPQTVGANECICYRKELDELEHEILHRTDDKG